jgi:hypothetical protein
MKYPWFLLKIQVFLDVVLCLWVIISWGYFNYLTMHVKALSFETSGKTIRIFLYCFCLWERKQVYYRNLVFSSYKTMKIYLHTARKTLAVRASKRVRNDKEGTLNKVVTNLKIENSSTVTGLGSSQRRVKAASLQIHWAKFVFHSRKCSDKKDVLFNAEVTSLQIAT